MIIRSRMALADACLALIELYSGETTLNLEVYSNCREQGYSLSNASFTRRVSFSEYRNDDSLVVYTGAPEQFSMQGYVPSDDIFRRQVHYGPTDLSRAARDIVEILSGSGE